MLDFDVGLPCRATSLVSIGIPDNTTKRQMELVVARHDEDIAWSEPFRRIRTVYHKPGAFLYRTPHTNSLARADTVILPNIGREAHTYISHIVNNYDALADWTVFLHGKAPSCGFFLADERTFGNHLLTNVSVLDYFLAKDQFFMPITGVVDGKLARTAWRSSFADGLPSYRLDRPVPMFPQNTRSDRWLRWEHNDFNAFIDQQTSLPLSEVIRFDEFFKGLVGAPTPRHLFFAQGAQFGASAKAIRTVPRNTYKRLMHLLEDGHYELSYYLEFAWLYVLSGGQFLEKTIAEQTPVPFLDHLTHMRKLNQARRNDRAVHNSIECETKSDVDYPWNDLLETATWDIETCQILCGGHPGCVGFTYLRGDNTLPGTCYIKAKMGESFITPNVVTGICSRQRRLQESQREPLPDASPLPDVSPLPDASPLPDTSSSPEQCPDHDRFRNVRITNCQSRIEASCCDVSLASTNVFGYERYNNGTCKVFENNLLKNSCVVASSRRSLQFSDDLAVDSYIKRASLIAPPPSAPPTAPYVRKVVQIVLAVLGGILGIALVLVVLNKLCELEISLVRVPAPLYDSALSQGAQGGLSCTQSTTRAVA